MRFRVVPPVPNGYQWWIVADTQYEPMPNMPLVEIHESVPGAEQVCQQLAERLNAISDKVPRR